MPPERIAGQILDLAELSGFHGHGVMPGIKTAWFRVGTPGRSR